jgi:uncharacterized protein
MFIGFARYSRDQSFSVLRKNIAFMLLMAAGSILGTFIGGLLPGLVPTAILLPPACGTACHVGGESLVARTSKL